MVVNPEILKEVEEAKDLLEIDGRFSGYKSSIDVVFGAAVGAFFGVQFVEAPNTWSTFANVGATVVLGAGYVMGLLMLGSRIARYGFKGNRWQIFFHLAWLAGLIGVGQYAFDQGFVLAAILIPWFVHTFFYAEFLYLVHVGLVRKHNV